MKRFIILITTGLLLLISTSSMAAWTWTYGVVSHRGPWLVWYAEGTSDGAALGATDLLAGIAEDATYGYIAPTIKDSTFCYLSNVPGAAATVPDNTYVVTITDSITGTTPLFAHTFAVTAAMYDLSEDYGGFWPCPVQLNVAADDVGSSGDKTKFIFICWVG